MDENLEVFFCDLCNTSVPQNDLDAGEAARIKGKVVGACCLREIRGRSAPAKPAPAARSGGAGMAVILLAAVAGAAMFLDWRLSEEVAATQTAIGSLAGKATEQQGRLRAIEEQLAASTTGRDLGGLRDAIAQLRQSQGEGESRLGGKLDRAAGRIETLERNVAQVREAQERHLSGVERLGREVRLLGEELAAVMARPRPAPVEEVETGSDEPGPMAAAPADAGASLPAELAHHVSKLADADPGTRFEAVDKLIQSRNPSVLDSLVAMTKDADPFVRRLTVEGLSDFRKPESVDALLTALADPEGIVRHAAYSSLRKLTGQTISFDPDGRKDDRRNAQRRWQDWWRKNRESF